MEENMEMSSLDSLIPRYYKGFDMNILLQKLLDKNSLTEEEIKIIGEAQNIYYKRYSEKTQKKWTDWKNTHPNEKYRRSIDPQRTDRR